MNIRELRKALESVDQEAEVGFTLWTNAGEKIFFDGQSNRKMREITDEKTGIKVVSVGYADYCPAHMVNPA